MQGMFGTYETEIPDTTIDEEYAYDVDPRILCDFPELVDANGVDSDRLSTHEGEGIDRFDIYVYRPKDPTGEWPDDGPHPAIFFVPGKGLNTVRPGGPATEPEDHFFGFLFEPMAQAGFVVFAIQPSSVEWGSGKRRAALACAMMWAKDAGHGWAAAADGRIGDSAVLMGHSRGGSAATRLTKSVLCRDSDDPAGDGCCLAPDACDGKDDLPPGTALDDYEICSTVSIAPRWNGIDRTEIRDPSSPPYLMIQGTLDEDTVGQGIPAYDANVSEDLAVAAEPSSLRLHDKVGLWVYGPMHQAWGGVDVNSPVELGLRGVAQAQATAPFFVEQFLRWQLFREPEARAKVLGPTKVSPLQDDFSPSVWEPSLWNVDGTQPYDPNLAVFYQGDDAGLSGVGRPLVYADFTQGTQWPGAERFIVDTLARGMAAPDCDGDISPSTMGTTVTMSPIGVGNAAACQGPAEEVGPIPGSLVGSDHATEALQIAWGDTFAGVQVEWSLEAGGLPLSEIADYTHLSFRVGNLVDSCPSIPDEFQLEVELVAEDPSGIPVVRTVLTDVIPDQHGEEVPGVQGFPICPSSHFMHTIRIPLVDFCDQGPGFDPSALTAVRIRFPESMESHEALVDSLEFTRDPGDAGSLVCSQSQSDWTCAPTDALMPFEISCAGEPDPACEPDDVVTNPVPLPTVSDELGDPRPGWVVHVPKGWLGDPKHPTSLELDGILDLCVAACELEWSDDPSITANCSDPGAFTTPTLRAVPGLGSTHRIRTDDQHGGGLFPGHALACDLEGDCCEAFDEALCAARSSRPTAARQPLARGEELRIDLSPATSKAMLITPGNIQDIPLAGAAGYSLCANPAGGPCPFYLGSLSVTATESITVTATCPDRSPFSVELTDLGIELLQPAFGIDVDGVQAFPSGALHVQGMVTVAGFTTTIRAINEDPVFLTADREGFLSAEVGLDFAVPCGTGSLPVVLLVELRSADAPAARLPEVEITTPSTAPCPGMLALTHDTSDPDDDLTSVRWIVDGVLLAPGIGTMPITRSHDLVAIARDTRGATTTDARTVTCE
ncbi:alpha/beta hydrolase family protein [Paraliomyxa miuraensis]|uniref:alpha/beta hydrolase family protein n=1 Tax=Paraliomyxa miuraensis TaxID=376150 RepID=UPI00225B3621|nr:hypothetical protein [Paraliomyxa miuraensis]MCX4246346.1 hypothetical protein [Paraliomyxa miuraensis]